MTLLYQVEHMIYAGLSQEDCQINGIVETKINELSLHELLEMISDAIGELP